MDIYKNGPADQAGLEFGDLIVAVNETPLDKPDALIGMIFTPGAKINLTYLRKGKRSRRP